MNRCSLEEKYKVSNLDFSYKLWEAYPLKNIQKIQDFIDKHSDIYELSLFREYPSHGLSLAFIKEPSYLVFFVKGKDLIMKTPNQITENVKYTL